jgi:membrane-anchored protein YejM (alkaline phosphatase superfamily)
MYVFHNWSDHMQSTLLSEAQRVANTREHLSWAHYFALTWLAVCLIIFGAAYGLAEIGDMPDANRTLVFIMLGTIIISSVIWQAAGFTMARLENLVLPRMK